MSSKIGDFHSWSTNSYLSRESLAQLNLPSFAPTVILIVCVVQLIAFLSNSLLVGRKISLKSDHFSLQSLKLSPLFFVLLSHHQEFLQSSHHPLNRCTCLSPFFCLRARKMCMDPSFFFFFFFCLCVQRQTHRVKNIPQINIKHNDLWANKTNRIECSWRRTKYCWWWKNGFQKKNTYTHARGEREKKNY